MRVSFHPLPGLTFICTILLAAFVALGIWQLQRLNWKLGLIAQVNNNLVFAPLSLDQAIAMGEAAQYHRVRLEGRFDNANEAYVFGTGVEGAPVFHVLVPFTTSDGRIMLVDRGIVPRDLRDRSTRRNGLIEGQTTVVGVWRAPAPAEPFTPAPDLGKRIWYSRDVAGIARVDSVRLAAPAIVEADATPNRGGWPKGGRQTEVNFRNEHLQYAITWFFLAAGLIAVYLAYHVSRGRLTVSHGSKV